MNPLSRTRLFTLSTLACATLFVAACGQQVSEERDMGPNAGLSNDELLKKAIANMKAAKSYHFEFKGGIPSQSFKMSPNMSIRADMQSNGKGSRATFSDTSPATVGPNPDSVILNTGTVEMLMVDGGWPYYTYDGGKTWAHYSVDTPMTWLMAMFGSLWMPQDYLNGEAYGEQFVQSLNLTDGSPRIERIDGITTRQVVADVLKRNEAPDLTNAALQGAESVSLWVSTEMTPTIRQMKVEGSNRVENIDAPYTLTWNWSHFNEDFGEVKPPPTETVKSP
jgi:hypothetical protein